MKIEGDGRQYWLVLNPDPDDEKIDRMLDLLREVWVKNKILDLTDLLYHGFNSPPNDEALIKALEENL